MHSRYTQRRCCHREGEGKPVRGADVPGRRKAPAPTGHGDRDRPKSREAPVAFPKGPEEKGKRPHPTHPPEPQGRGRELSPLPLLGGDIPILKSLFGRGKEGDMMALLVLLLLLLEGKEESRGTVLTLLFFFLL